MKKLIVTLIFLSHSFLAMADEKDELIQFIKENSAWVGTLFGSSYCGSSAGSYAHVPFINTNTFDDINLLIFKDKNLTTLPSNLSLIPNLYKIEIDNVNLESFPQIDTLKCVDFANVDFDKVSDDVFKNKQLIGLLIPNLKLTSLPQNISNLKNLTSLDLSNNNLKTLSKEIGELTNLKTLNLENNQLIELPSEIGNLTNLGNINLNNNQLSHLPKEFENLVNLGALYLNNNKIEEIPNTLLNLGYFRITNNKLKELPKNFGDTINLKVLDVSNNNLKTLPDNFSNLKELRDLYLNNNQIEKLPKEFFRIFETIHYEYGDSRGGAYLTIANNRISFLDNSLCKVVSFSDFYFSNNYFDEVPKCLSDIGLWSISNTNGVNIAPSTFDTFNEYTIKNLILKAGWEFAKDIIIYYSYVDNKTLKFEPIYQSDINITSYLWDFGDGNSSNEETPIHTYSNYGDYNVTLTINGDMNFSKLISLYPRVLELKKGWNLITPPTKDDINASLFESVWSYENSKWENTHNFLIPTIGYWVKLNEDLNYSYSGEVYTIPSYKIKDGWNLIGNGEKIINFDENSTYYIFRDNNWIKNPVEVKIGEGVWIKK